MTGVDLSQYRNDAYTLPERGLYSESLTATKYNGNSLLGIIKGPWHYIQTTRSELYNRRTDPKEEVNLIKSEPHRARMLQSDLAGILESAVNNDQDTAIQIDQKTVNMLESLGYVGGTMDTDFSFNTEKTDPKDLIDIHNVFARIAGPTQTEHFVEAVRQLEELIRHHPDIAEAYKQLAEIYILMEKWDKAIEATQKMLSLVSDDTDALKALADVYAKNKQYQESIDTVHRIIEIDPDADAWYLLSQNYSLLADTDKALKYAFNEIAFTHNDDLLTSLNDVAWLQASQKDPEVFNPVSALRYAEQAAALLDKTPANKENQAQVLDTLAVALAANGKFKEAIETATQAYELSIKQDKSAFAERINNRIKLYKQGKAYRE
jgi:tetratricopeptide (TPR) repeat protein